MSRPINRNDISLVGAGEEFRIRPDWNRKSARRRLSVRRNSEDYREDFIDYNDLGVLVQEFLRTRFFAEQ